MSEPRVSVVIPCRNRPSEVRRALESVAAQDFPRDQFEVLLCDDGSEIDLRPAVEHAQYLGLDAHYLRQPPRGPAAARNLGIRNARGSIIAMTDSDTQPRPDWLGKLVAALDSHPEAVGVEGRVEADNAGEFAPLGESPINPEGGVYLTCNCAYRREALESVGGFDETFPYPAYEDTDLAARIQQMGEIVWQPEAVVIHPERPLTFAGVWKKLHHWEYILLMGFRYGYLGWKKYPTRHPRLRVAALSTLALPLAKFRDALKWAAKRPGAALKLLLLGVFEMLGALFIVVPKALVGDYRRKKVRGSFLKLESLHIEEIRLKR
ncbi:MAG: glycosyltransferase family 2 protein [Acidobacteria bacterium]|nr:glycosyltransferase family 2 protein [Acidobacteriota bacterium]MCW5969254.1 glycosyltransferase family 2 protein [Blastocatellales bacterium]